METVNIREAKTHLSRLLRRVAEGEEIVIARRGKPVAKLAPYLQDAAPRQPGFWRGRVQIADDFGELPTDAQSAFRGEKK